MYLRHDIEMMHEGAICRGEAAGLSLAPMNPVTATQPIRARAWLAYPLAFLLSLVAVSVSAFVGGLGPGILAALTSGLLAAYYLVPPLQSFAIGSPEGWIGTGAFALVSGVVILLINGVLHAHEIRRQGEE